MSAYRVVYLTCDHRGEPRELSPGKTYRPLCGKRFDAPPELGYPPLATMRREARKAGWAYVRHPGLRTLDKDYCPEHAGDAAREGVPR